MKTISLKIDKAVFEETEDILSEMKKPRNRYINEAIAHYNDYQKRIMLQEKLRAESNLVKEDAAEILRDFESIDPTDEAI